MIKTIKFDESHSVELDTSAGWLFIYKSQFGHDILQDMLPLLDTVLQIAVPFMEASGPAAERIKEIEPDEIREACISLAGMEVTTILQVIWAMGKNHNPDTPPIEKWISEFPMIPLDVVLPELLGAVLQSSVSSKNAARLMKLLEPIQAKL